MYGLVRWLCGTKILKEKLVLQVCARGLVLTFLLSRSLARARSLSSSSSSSFAGEKHPAADAAASSRERKSIVLPA
jgi:hypothetical protein